MLNLSTTGSRNLRLKMRRGALSEEERSELLALRKEVKNQRMEKEILKKEVLKKSKIIWPMKRIMKIPA